MNDRPNCVCENIRTECGRPLSPISSGIVTCFSTSSGARAREQRDDVHLDVGDVGKRLDRQRRNAANAAADEQQRQQRHRTAAGAARTRRRGGSWRATKQARAVTLRARLKQLLEQQRAPGHDPVAGSQAVETGTMPSCSPRRGPRAADVPALVPRKRRECSSRLRSTAGVGTRRHQTAAGTRPSRASRLSRALALSTSPRALACGCSDRCAPTHVARPRMSPAERRERTVRRPAPRPRSAPGRRAGPTARRIGDDEQRREQLGALASI